MRIINYNKNLTFNKKLYEDYEDIHINNLNKFIKQWEYDKEINDVIKVNISINISGNVFIFPKVIDSIDTSTITIKPNNNFKLVSFNREYDEYFNNKDSNFELLNYFKIYDNITETTKFLQIIMDREVDDAYLTFDAFVLT